MIDLARLKKYSFDRWFIVNKCKGKNVLEIGCVNHSIRGIKVQRKLGIFLLDYLHKFSKTVVGIDIDKKGLNYLHHQRYNVLFGDAQNFKINKKFDVIVASKLIDHLLNIDGFLKSCRESLYDNGILIISDDNILCLPKLIVWYFKKKMGNPDKDITVKILPNYFENFSHRYGFSIKEIRYFYSGSSKIFKFVKKIFPKILIYPPLFYPQYIMLLEKNDK